MTAVPCGHGSKTKQRIYAENASPDLICTAPIHGLRLIDDKLLFAKKNLEPMRWFYNFITHLNASKTDAYTLWKPSHDKHYGQLRPNGKNDYECLQGLMVNTKVDMCMKKRTATIRLAELGKISQTIKPEKQPTQNQTTTKKTPTPQKPTAHGPFQSRRQHTTDLPRMKLDAGYAESRKTVSHMCKVFGLVWPQPFYNMRVDR